VARIIHLDEDSYFNFDTATLFVKGNEVGKPLGGIAFQILEYLVINSPNFRTEKQIRENCWKEDTGTGSLSQHIKKVRDAIGDKHPWKHILQMDGKYKCVHGFSSDSEFVPKYEETKQSHYQSGEESFADLSQKARQYEKSLIGQELKSIIGALMNRKDIVHVLDDLVRRCTGCHFDDLIGLALEQLGICEVILDSKECDEYIAEAQLLLRRAITHIEIEKYVRQISAFRERLLSEKDRDAQKFLKSEIQDVKGIINDKKSELTNYEKEIEALQQDGISKGSVLSLSVYKRSNDFEE